MATQLAAPDFDNPEDPLAHVRWPHLAAVLLLLGTVPLAAQERFGSYPATRMGGNYMHNFYLPPAVNSAPWAPSWAPDGKRSIAQSRLDPRMRGRIKCRPRV